MRGACAAGSNCSESSTLYSVEPVAQPGFWRSAIPDGEDGFACDPGRRHRPYCWDFAPCAPENACAGDNLCQKGYTEDKCAQCCDFNFKDNPNCAGTLDKNGDVQTGDITPVAPDGATGWHTRRFTVT